MRERSAVGLGHLISPADCVGCVACTRACPSGAIRVRGHLARLQSELCIECGECVRVCKYDAAKPATTEPRDFERFEYTVAIPSLTLYAQFGRDVAPWQVLAALEAYGFDEAHDLSWMCESIAAATDALLTKGSAPWPKISVTCPAVVRLIQLRYPGLIGNLVPLETARELQAKLLRRRIAEERGIAPDAIGIFFITPCTAIMSSILDPVGLEQSYLDGAISIRDLYGPLLREIRKGEATPKPDTAVSTRGLLWAMAGGEIAGMRNANTMTVKGVQDVQYVFDHIEAGKFQGVDFIEAYICPDGCVSGGLTIEGRYAAQRSIQEIAKRAGEEHRVQEEKVRSLLESHFFDLEEAIKARPVRPLDGDLRAAIARRRQQEEIERQLPKKDCAACGAPGCMELAEDVVRGRATLDDCVFVRIERLQKELDALREGRNG